MNKVEKITPPDFDFSNAWCIEGDGLDGPGLIKVKKSDADYKRQLHIKNGFWLIQVDKDIGGEQNIDALASFLRETTGGIRNDSRDAKRVTVMTQAFCNAYGLQRVTEEDLPQPLRGLPDNVFVLKSGKPFKIA